MKFRELDARMRVFETAHDHCALPGLYLVARLDGRNFTRLTREDLGLVAPFDEGFRDRMVETMEHLVRCGIEVVYAYTQSDEISLLLEPATEAFGRKLRKLVSVLAGEASGKLSVLLDRPVCFDGRISQLPRAQDVVDYFRWRNEDAARNALQSHCYWLLRGEGRSAAEATDDLAGMSVADRNELLFARGVNFDRLPSWEKRGTAVYWENYERKGLNPVRGVEETAQRRRLKRDFELPMKDEYSEFVRGFVRAARAS